MADTGEKEDLKLLSNGAVYDRSVGQITHGSPWTSDEARELKRKHLEQVDQANREALADALVDAGVIDQSVLEKTGLTTADASAWITKELVRLYRDENTGGREKLGALKRLDEKLVEQPLGWERGQQGEGQRVTVNQLFVGYSEDQQRELLERLGRTIVDEVTRPDQDGS